MQPSAPIRVLGLHGYGQNGAAFEKALRKLFRSAADRWVILCPDAPHAVADARGRSALDQSGARSWWRGMAPDPSDPRDAEALEMLRELRDFGPNVLAGFSQGAACATLLAADGALSSSLRCAVIIGGADIPASAAPPAPIELRSLHVVGDKDDLVPPSESARLAARYAAPETIHHDHGHVVAYDAAMRNAVRAFIESATRSVQQ
jgi:predicted esterase